jgi:hypothetical protein
VPCSGMAFSSCQLSAALAVVAGTLSLSCGAEVSLLGGAAGDGGAPTTSSGGAAGDGGSATTSAGGAGGEGGGCVEGIGAWREELIMEDALAVTDAAFDSRGALHVVVDHGELVHVRGSEGSWTLAPIASTPLWTTRMALGPDDALHLALGAYHWMYATAYWTNRGGSWETFEVSSDGGPAAVAVHPDGTPHLVYLDWPDGNFIHVENPADAAAPRTVVVTPQYESPPAMTFDAEGRLWLAYAGATSPGEYALQIGTVGPDGQLELVVSEPHEHLLDASDLAIDGDGRLHVAFVGEYQNAYYGRLDSGGWSATLLDSSIWFPASDYPPRVAVDALGRPSVVITRESAAPRYLRHDGADWQAEDLAGPSRHITSMVVDDVGAAHLFALDSPESGAWARVWYLTNRKRC